jgi:hypothetical protein
MNRGRADGYRVGQRCWRGIGLSMLLLLAGCFSPSMLHTSARVPDPGKGSPGRYVVRASQYTFTTDFDLSRDDPMILEMDRLRESMVETLGIIPRTTPIRVVIFEDRDRYESFLRSYFPELPDRRAFFIQEGEDQRSVFAVRGERLRSDLRHEVAHALMHSAGCKIPLWLDEGLAEYFESSEMPGQVHVSHVEKLADLRSTGWMPSGRRLESIIDLWQMKPADYRESWLWVHFLLNSTPENRRLIVEALRPPDGAVRELKLYDRMLASSTDPDRDVAKHLEQLAQSLPSLQESRAAFSMTEGSATKVENEPLAAGPGLGSARQKLGLEKVVDRRGTSLGAGSGTSLGVSSSSKDAPRQVVKSQSFVPGFEGSSLLEVLGDHLLAPSQGVQDPSQVLPGGEPDEELLQPFGAAGPP